MTSKTKKTLAREGLILLAIIIIAYFLAQNVDLKILLEELGLIKITNWSEAKEIHSEATKVSFLFSVIVYGCIRFIVWAMMILREK